MKVFIFYFLSCHPTEYLLWSAVQQQELQATMGGPGEAAQEATGQECLRLHPQARSHALHQQCPDLEA